MSDADFKAELLRLIGRAREALLWKLEGLSEYDARRPMMMPSSASWLNSFGRNGGTIARLWDACGSA